MRVQEITDGAAWDGFQKSRTWAQFTQSWLWGEFRRLQGRPVRRFAFVEGDGAWKAAVQMEFRRKRFGAGYWYAARGPVFCDGLSPDETRRIFSESLSSLADARSSLGLERALFWRFEPPVALDGVEGLMPLALRRGPTLSPASTIVLDLTQPDDKLQAGFHHKTRYNIRLAARHDVKIRIGKTPADMKVFVALMKETAERDEFVQHDLDYLYKTVEFLQREGLGRLRLAEHQGKILAANLEVTYGDTVTYLHGSSSSEARNVMAPFALHWDAILQARKEGYRKYDLWGANPASKAMPNYKASWEGITRFKRGWGGTQVDLPGTWDLPFFMPVYRLAFLKHFWRG